MKKHFNIKLSDLVKNHKDFLFLTAILLLMSLILYRGYIFGGRLFLFVDFGSDSVRVSFPTYYYFLDWLKGGMPLWSDQMGIGTSVLSHADIVFDPFTYILFLFGKTNIINMFVYMVIAKIIFSGIFFWIFLDKYKLSSYAKIIGGITYAFCGYMIVNGQNYVFGTIYVYLPLIILGFEIWFQNKKSWLLILMFTLTALYFFYYFYMTAIFFGVYAIFRYLMIYKFRLKRFLNYLLSLVGYGLLSLGLSAFIWLPYAALTSNNLRIGSSFPTFATMFLPDIKIIMTALGRLFGYDTLGSPTTGYIGYQHDYFALAIYSGVLTIVLLPQIFSDKNKRKKNAHSIFFLALLAFLFIPFFSFVFNGFSDFTFRWTYVLHFSLSLFLAIAVDTVFQKRKLNYYSLFLTVVSLLAISFALLHYLSTEGLPLSKSIEAFKMDYFLIIIYTLLTILFFRLRYKNVIKGIILTLVCIELIIFPANFINERLTTTPDPVKNNLGYFDSTIKVVKYLKKYDSDIYRIEKSYDSVVSENGTPSDNEAMVQGYRGLRSYSGNNQPNYILFLQDAGIWVKYPNFSPPADAKPQDLNYADTHYINGVGDRYLLQSFLGVKYFLVKNSVPVPSYYQYLTKIDDITVYQNKNYLPLGFTLDSYITKEEFMKLDNLGKDIALVSFVVIDNPNDLSGILPRGNNKTIINSMSETDIENLINERRNIYFKITSYKSDHIQGEIFVEQNKVLVLTIPYDQGWTVSVDNDRISPIKVDNGLIGIKLTRGTHVIELKYFPPEMMGGIFISISAIILHYFLFFVRKQNSKDNNSNKDGLEVILY